MNRLLLLLAILPFLYPPPAVGQAEDPTVLVFSKTAGFRHGSIETGVQMIENLGSTNGFDVVHTEEATHFTDANLADYWAIVFLSTTGNILDGSQQAAMERYIADGGGFVGIHAAADTEYEWPWYGELVGAYFQSHPAIQNATVVVNDRVHPSTEMLPLRWQRTDEWYNYQQNPRGKVHVLLTLDESTYSGGEDGHDHPIAWCRPFDGGRSWYTGGGHTEGSYSETLFREHVLGGLLWAMGMVDGECSATLEQSFEREILDDDTLDPMELTVLPDGRVVYVERGGAVKIYDNESKATTVAGQLNVFTQHEDGLLGVTQDPDFEENSWIYLFYSPSGTEAKQRISRYTLVGDNLDLDSEQVLLEIPTQRTQCCHSGGSLTFGPDGNLYASLGDNTNPFDSNGYSPLDERSGRQPWDAQRSSANTQDLRGKILRITPQDDGTYTIPEGNLFSDPSEGRPEIYIMGNRNPFRISLDDETGWLYWGEVGPDASAPTADRGPKGYDEFNQARAAGNYGWPYCVADNKPYVDYNFATQMSGSAFDCAAGPTNDSPNSNGASVLPPARPAWIWYAYDLLAEFPELGIGGRTAMAGPVYHFDYTLSPERKLPAYYNDTIFIYEWSRHWIKEVKLDDGGGVLKINPFLDGLGFLRPMDMALGPDGALYLLEWGSAFNGGNTNSRLTRISYTAGPAGPVAVANADPTHGPIPLTVQFSASGSYNPVPSGELAYSWDFDGDGTEDAAEAEPSYTYTEPGTFVARLTVTDSQGFTSVDQVTVVAGNSPPVVSVNDPAPGSFVGWNERVSFDVSVADLEDGSTEAGTIDCASVSVEARVVIDGIPEVLEQMSGCEGSFVTASGNEIDDGSKVYHVISAVYADEGAENEEPAVGEGTIILHPKRIEAEHYVRNGGVQFEPTSDPMGSASNAGYIDHGDFLSFSPVNLKNIDAITFRVASASEGGRIEIRLDDVGGPVIGTAQVFGTGGWQAWTNVTTNVSDPGDSRELFLVFLREAGAAGLFNVNYIVFEGSGVSVDVEGAAAVPAGPILSNIFPNPSGGRTTISYELDDLTQVRLEVFDVLGRRVTTLADGLRPSGGHEVEFAADGVANGVYFVRLTTPAGALSRQLVVSK